MRLGISVVATTLLVAVLAAPSLASYTTEVIFSGDGWYLPDAMSQVIPGGYGLFEEVLFSYSVEPGIPEGTHCLYLDPDFSLLLRPEMNAGVSAREIIVGPDGIDFDGQQASWESMGMLWAPGYGLSLGEHYIPALDPGSVVGDHEWDLDGGGADFVVSVRDAKGPSDTFSPEQYEARFAMQRSLTWLSGQPIGTWLAGGLAPLLGGLPLDGLEQALDGFAPQLSGWDTIYYSVDYSGSVRLTGCSEPVPEPATFLLLTGGLGALAAARLRRRR